MTTTDSQSDRTPTSSIGYRRSASKRHLALPVLGQTAGSGLGLALKGLAQFPLFGWLISLLKDLVRLRPDDGGLSMQKLGGPRTAKATPSARFLPWDSSAACLIGGQNCCRNPLHASTQYDG